MIPLIKLCSLIVLPYITSIAASPQVCDSDTLLDVVLLQDTTESYRYTWPVLIAAMTTVTEELLEDFPKARFGLSTFRDYGELYKYPRPDEKCYHFVSSLSRRETFLQELKQLDKITGGGSEVEESSFTAIGLALLDKQLRWRDNGAGQNTLRVLIVATDAASLTPNDRARKYPPMKFDGTDSCSNNIPTTEALGKAIHDSNTYFLGLIEHIAVSQWNDYLKIFKRAGASGEVRQISVSDKFGISQRILEGIKGACEDFSKKDPLPTDNSTVTPSPNEETENEPVQKIDTDQGQLVETENQDKESKPFPTGAVVGAAAGGIVIAALVTAVAYAMSSRTPRTVGMDYEIADEPEALENADVDKEWMTNIDESVYE